MASVSPAVPAAAVLKAVRGWRLFPCRTEIDRAVMAAHPSQPAGSTGCDWLMPAAEMAGLAGGSWRSPPDPALAGWACPPRIATRALSVQAGSVRAARYFTLATMRRWGTAHSSQDIAIVVSEMVTNALQHALPGPGDAGPRGPVRLGLLQQGPWVLCAVADPGTAVPVPRTPGFLAEAGRGLQMICAFSDLWGCTTPGDAGKVVWAMFTARHAPPSQARCPGRAGRDPMPGTAR
jgi:anti-sigma regulatory factor (Ser/Thr protein kinase)